MRRPGPEAGSAPLSRSPARRRPRARASAPAGWPIADRGSSRTEYGDRLALVVVVALSKRSFLVNIPIPFAQGGRLICIQGERTAGGKPRPYDGYGNTLGLEQSFGLAMPLNAAWSLEIHVGPGFTPGRAAARESRRATNLSEGDRCEPGIQETGYDPAWTLFASSVGLAKFNSRPCSRWTPRWRSSIARAFS